jgi:hypothetical protein
VARWVVKKEVQERRKKAVSGAGSERPPGEAALLVARGYLSASLFCRQVAKEWNVDALAIERVDHQDEPENEKSKGD